VARAATGAFNAVAEPRRRQVLDVLRDTTIQSGLEIGMQEQMNLLEELAISLMS
jgi:hypothetical protein